MQRYRKNGKELLTNYHRIRVINLSKHKTQTTTVSTLRWQNWQQNGNINYFSAVIWWTKIYIKLK